MSKSKEKLDIKILSIPEIVDKINTYKKELLNLRFQKTLGELKNTARFSQVRKNVARLNTELIKKSKQIESSK
jgi:large subunit ribosomal protein L29